jgi:UrcA family protein
VSTGAGAAELDQIVLDKPVVTDIGRDTATDAPIERVTVTARVIPDPETLTTDSGVKLLNDYIVEAARKACFEANPLEMDDGTCVREAVRSAQQQVKHVVAEARASKTTVVG